MPIEAKHLILTKIETSQGVDASPGAPDVVAIFRPTVRDQYDIQQRQPAGFSLSQDVDPVGRNTRTVTFAQDFAGSGALGTAPPWGKHVRACGLRELDTDALTISTVVGKIQMGEAVQVTGDATRWGIAVGSAATGATSLTVAWMAGGKPTASDALTGMASGATCDVDGIATRSKAYRPDSTALVEVVVAAWAGGSAPAVGAHLVVVFAGEIVGGGTVFSKTTDTQFKLAMHWGAIAAGVTLRTAASATTTVTTAIQTNVPSLTILSNLDTLERRTLGARGSWRLTGDNSQALQFEFTFLGQVGPHTDAAPPALTGLSTIAPPRLVGAVAGFGIGADFLRIPLKRIELDLAAQVGMRGDANQPGGDIGSDISTRRPQLRITVDKVGYGSANLLSRLQQAQTVRYACKYGSTAGNSMVIAAPRCQVVSIEDGADNGIATNIVTLEPKRVTFDGDDEFILAQD